MSIPWSSFANEICFICDSGMVHPGAGEKTTESPGREARASGCVELRLWCGKSSHLDAPVE